MTNSAKDFLAGCAGGMAQVLIGQPFDIVKVRLQAATQGFYNSSLDCFKKIIKNEGGLPALWKGSLPPLIGVGAAVSIQFGVNEKTKQFAQKVTGKKKLNTSHLFGCGVVAGMANSLISIPVEHTRIRMQIEGNKRTTAGSYVKNILKLHGLTGLYKGAIPTLWRETLAMGIYFSMYEWITSRMLLKTGTRTSLSVPEIAMAGGLSGIALWFATFPIDIIKTKIQTDSFQNPTYKGMVDCLSKTMKSNGLRGLYRGLSPCLLRAVPANSATFIAYEAALKTLTAKTNKVGKFTIL